MKVSNSGNSSLQQIYQHQTDRSAQGDPAAHAAAPATGRRDSIELSNQAQLLQKATQAANRVDEDRLDRIARLREQVQNDSYEVPVEQLATLLGPALF